MTVERRPALRGIAHEEHSNCGIAPPTGFTIPFDSARI
jgi:hypothetical protein